MKLADLRLYKRCLSAIVLWTHREVNPVAALLISLDEQLIVILLRAVRDVQQDVRIAQCLLKALTSDIHRTPRQVIARGRPAHSLIHLRRASCSAQSRRTAWWFWNEGRNP